jgi:hypothetical protein
MNKNACRNAIGRGRSGDSGRGSITAAFNAAALDHVS